MKQFVFLAVMLLMIMSACQKEEISPAIEPDFTAVEENASSTIEDSLSSDDVHLKISSSSILNATNANQISSFYFASAWKYRSKYQHIKQYSGECSWTSYVLATAAIVNGNLGWYHYPVNHTKITQIKNWCGSSYIERLRDYANQKDYTWFPSVYLCKKSKTSSGRFSMIKQMLYHLLVYQKPFLAIITRNGISHYVVVWNINWKQGGTGSYIYYTDPLDNPTTFNYQLKSMSFSTFLDKMGPQNYTVSSYCALFLR